MNDHELAQQDGIHPDVYERRTRMADEQQIADACRELVDFVYPDNTNLNEELFEQVEELVVEHYRRNYSESA